MCKIILVINNTVIMDKIIFWVLWWSTSQCSSWQHGQSRRTKIQDTPNIRLDKTKIHGSIHSGMYSVCATSGANSPTIPNTIGNTQQNKWGNTVAIIPNFTALFFILNPFILCIHHNAPRPKLATINQNFTPAV